jgi:signal transduction histidine kinase
MAIDRNAALVLIADDNRSNLELLCDVLVTEGLDVAFASNGHGVLEIVRHKKPDLILLDRLMPDLDGFETCRRIKDDPLTKDIPVIFTTSLSGTKDILRGFDVGAVDYLSRPFEHAELIARVRTQISLRKITQALQDKTTELESEIRERAAAQRALVDAVCQLERRTEELHEAQARMIKLEKQSTEIQMAGGFAHEMRNALASAKLRLAVVYSRDGDQESSACHDTRELLKELLVLSQANMPAELLAPFRRLISGINSNEKKILSAFSSISAQIERALEVTGRILEYSRHGFERASTAPFDLNEVIDKVVRSVEQSLAEGRVSLTVDSAPGCVLQGNENHFYSILSNLVLNARNALVEVAASRERLIKITLRQAQKSVLIEVEDSGVGIPAENLPRIFEPFFSTNPVSGTGLGLSMVKRLVFLYGGTIDVRSEVDRGTTFSVLFPRAPS